MKTLDEILEDMAEEDEDNMIRVLKNRIRSGIIKKKDIKKEYNKLKESLES